MHVQRDIGLDEGRSIEVVWFFNAYMPVGNQSHVHPYDPYRIMKGDLFYVCKFLFTSSTEENKGLNCPIFLFFLYLFWYVVELHVSGVKLWNVYIY